MNDWTTDAADTVERVVVIVRDKTVVPAQTITKAIVYGLVAGSLVSAALLLLFVGLFRALDVYLPGGVWAAYLVLGGIFVIAGVFCWSRRNA
jgi:hypothetical protein